MTDINKTAIALGTFDGVHAGHIAVLKEAVSSGLDTVCIAFRVPPKCFFQTQNIILTPEKDKTRLIKETGIKKVDYIDFEEVKDLTPEEFFKKINDKYNISLIVCGYNYSFGKGGKGDTALLKKLCQDRKITLKVVEKVTVNGDTVSSSFIRELLKTGHIEKAVSLLPDGFSISGEVIHGDRRGTGINFPTINQYYPENRAEIKFGVYMSSAVIDGKTYYGMTNIGFRPTYPVKKPLCETNLFNFSDDLYGQNIKINLLSFIRDEKTFSSLSELKEAIETDKKEILKRLRKD